MSELSLFLKGNKKKKENAKYTATNSLCDAKGNPLEWVIKPLSTKENDLIRDNCMIEVKVKGNPDQSKEKLDTTKYLARMICACVVEPNLHNKELQDSYGVKTPEDLVKEMIDNPGEYDNLAMFVQTYNGFDETVGSKVKKAKN